MEKTFKIKKLSKRNVEAQIEKEIIDYIDFVLCSKYYDTKKRHYVNEIQKNVKITVKIEITE